MNRRIECSRIFDYSELTQIMSQDVLGLDFEFGNKALPLAVGIAGANGVKEFRFVGVKSPERLNALQAISANGKKLF